MAIKRAAKITIDFAALQHNFQQVKKHAPDSKIMPVIKANAYGHGMLQVARNLPDADGFAVAQLAEAVYLREQGIEKPLTVFQGFLNKSQLQQCIQYQLRPAISQLWQLDLLQTELQNNSLDIWLKINTGMGRLGLQPDDVERSYQQLEKNACIKQTGLMMHFANADEPGHESNKQQISCFQAILDNRKTQTSVSNSAAIISQLFKPQDWVRPGIMLYGSSPFPNQSAKDLNLKPVMSLQAELISINTLKKGQHVGYGDSWTCPQDMPVGIVNIGYGDGYPRLVSGARVAINRQLTQLIGRVSMDSVAIDLRGITAQCGDVVELWGAQVPVDNVAASAGTISYELLCNTSSLLKLD